MKRGLFRGMPAAALALALAALASSSPADAVIGEAPPSTSDVAAAITELDVQRARTLLAAIDVDSAPLAIERARLAIYMGDCDSAQATLSTLSGVREAAALAELAKNCARATAGAIVKEDTVNGLWIRFQDDADVVLLPFLSRVAVGARAAIEKDLGVVMPRPLRIDLVRDHFSLSALSGLPLQAAETTGTVAVARWGRVNMISPRAAGGGFPWEDTLAHEITHLAITRATRDMAPLWLQEGLAKRQEIRWRPLRPFDGEPSSDLTAREALLSGQSVGIDKLGPSIAMLPSADAAAIAFAEVSSFVSYWVRENGPLALRLLFADLKALGVSRAEEALVSVSGYDLPGWNTRWQEYLLSLPAPKPSDGSTEAPSEDERVLAELLGEKTSPADGRDRARKLRIGELLFLRGAAPASAERFRSALKAAPTDPTIRWKLGRSLIASDRFADGAPLFQGEHSLDYAQSGWFALEGRYKRSEGDVGAAAAAFDFALSLDPYLEDAACEGIFRVPGSPGPVSGAPATAGRSRGSDGPDAMLPKDADRRALCEAARKIQKN
jgi:tetratricopeptide (TPR) repeat protein